MADGRHAPWLMAWPTTSESPGSGETAHALQRAMLARAGNAAAQAEALVAIDASWGSRAERIGDLWLVLSGPGFYVNRALPAAATIDITEQQIELVVARSRAFGVPPAIEVTSQSGAETTKHLVRCGFEHDPSHDVAVLLLSSRDGEGPDTIAADNIVVRPVTSEHDLERWQETSAAGWGHVDPEARSVSDAFTRAAHVTDGDGMVLAFELGNDGPVGCASMTIRDGVAMLGGMSTRPEHRRRGVQTALVRRRLAMAEEQGCDLIAATASTGSDSERNLMRLGFEPQLIIETWQLDG